MFALSFETRAQAELAESALAAEGFRVELQEQFDSSVVLVATPRADPRSVESVSARMESVPRELGGSVLGHGGLSSHGLGDATKEGA